MAEPSTAQGRRLTAASSVPEAHARGCGQRPTNGRRPGHGPRASHGGGVGAGTAQAVDLALEELVGNTIRYGFDDARHWITIEIAVHPEVLIVTLFDDARPFDPTRHPEPPAPRSLAEAPIGGMGIAMVRRAVRRWSYRREGHTNRLELEIAREA